MKKILAILAIAISATMIGCSPASAQGQGANVIPVTSDSGLVTGWVANTASKIWYCSVSAAWDVAGMGLVITKVSGTVAGTAIPVASMDGVNFFTISRPSIAATTLRPAFKDTVTATNVTTNVVSYELTNATDVSGQTPVCLPYKYYGIKYTGSGTMVATAKAYASFRHK